jgi:small-conductance mechanosensitive channel
VTSGLLLALLLSGPTAEPLAQTKTPESATPSETKEQTESHAQALERLDKEEFDLGRMMDSAQLDLASAERRFAAAQERLDAEREPSQALREEVAARRLQLSSEQRVVSLLEERIERVKTQKTTRGRLARLERGAVSPERLAEWRQASDENLERGRRELAVKTARIDELRQELEFTRDVREKASPGSPEQRWVGVKAQAIENLLRHYEKDVAELGAVVDLEGQLTAIIERETEKLPLSARLRALLHQFRVVWNYQLTSAEEEPITPGKIVNALLIFLIGYFVASVVSRGLGRRVFPRIRLEEGASQAFQSLAFYLLLIIAFITALRMVEIPLTAFAVLGGALAIGVGFGSQNVVGNFISGIILLAERPIKIGDLIELEGVYGSVERVGLRSTRVRSGDNFHIIVPNSAFLENNVINWTHTDPRVRVHITVGVVYGSPTREVERLFRVVLNEHPLVLQHPEPIVLFKDFGDNALIFEIRFWIEMRTITDRLRIESDIRFRIDDLFREAEIVIAFPQRDVHLDSASPIEVKLTDATRPTDAEDA